jgi:hypothetical protein
MLEPSPKNILSCKFLQRLIWFTTSTESIIPSGAFGFLTLTLIS